VSTVPNHITGNYTRIRTCTFVAMCGTFGYELDLETATPAELLQFKDHVQLFKRVSPIIWQGELFRLWNPFQVEVFYSCSHVL
jgi:alpha-galactosidase